MNNPIMAIYDYNDASRVAVSRLSGHLRDDTDHPVSFALVYYQQASGVGAGYPAGGPGRFDETDYRQGKV